MCAIVNKSSSNERKNLRTVDTIMKKVKIHVELGKIIQHTHIPI